MRVVRVREEIVLLGGPGDAGLVLRVRVLRRRRVEGVHAAVQVRVVDELVEVLEPRVCVEVLKVRAHGEHDIILRHQETSEWNMFSTK